MPEIKVLIIDDEADVGNFFRRLLSKKGFSVTVALNGAEAETALRKTAFVVAMVDLKLPDTDGLTLLKKIKSIQPHCEAIIMTGYSTTKTAVKAMQLGAYDYLEKPFDNIDEVEKLIEKAAISGTTARRGLPAEAEWTPIAREMGFQVGLSPVMRRLVDIAYKIAKKNINVLIQGETGTGKEVLARFIHNTSNRSNQIFIPVNCGALPENLLESELFGHEKGAFTGASSIRHGIFEMANHGTLFLDEIGEASQSIQVKLLRVLESGEFLRIGGEKYIKTDVRIIAATNMDLEEALQNKTFREDLFYRLDVVNLTLPPLRQRREDIPLLVEFFVRKANPDLLISSDTMELLCNYHWPGNIRELANSINQAVALCDNKILLPEHLSAKILSGGQAGVGHRGHTGTPVGGDSSGHPVSNGNLPSIRDLKDCLEYYSSAPEALQEVDGEELAALLHITRRFEKKLLDIKGNSSLAPSLSLQDIEARAISEALDYCNGNITLAARSLGIGRTTIYRKMKEYNITALAGGTAKSKP